MSNLDDKSFSSIEGVYEVTLNSESFLGTFKSIGKVVIAELNNHQVAFCDKLVIH